MRVTVLEAAEKWAAAQLLPYPSAPFTHPTMGGEGRVQPRTHFSATAAASTSPERATPKLGDHNLAGIAVTW